MTAAPAPAKIAILRVGHRARYQGSQTDLHGIYHVRSIHRTEDGTRYAIFGTENGTLRELWNVSPGSLVPLSQ